MSSLQLPTTIQTVLYKRSKKHVYPISKFGWPSAKGMNANTEITKYSKKHLAAHKHGQVTARHTEKEGSKFTSLT